MRRLFGLIAVGLFAASPTRSETVVIPYTGGKAWGIVTIELDNWRNVSPDTVQLGEVFSVIPYFAIYPITVCSNMGELGLAVSSQGVVRRRWNADTSWHDYGTFPLTISSMVNLDTVPLYLSRDALHDTTLTERGFPVAAVGDYECVSETYYLIDSTYRQIVFVQHDGTYAKLQVASHHDTAYGSPTSPFHILKSVTLRYVISDDPDDLVDPGVSIRPARLRYRSVGAGAVEYYNPLGIRVRPEAGRPAPALPVPRARPAETPDR